MRAFFQALCLVGSLGWVLPAAAENSTARTQEQIDADILALIQNQPIERFIAKLLEPIRNAPTPGKLTREDVDSANATARARLRAAHVAEFLQSDLNGDGVVTVEEVERADGGRRRKGPVGQGKSKRRADQMSRGLEQLLDADRNGDGRLDLAEMLASAERQPAGTVPGRQNEFASLLIELDADGDGAVTIRKRRRGRASSSPDMTPTVTA